MKKNELKTGIILSYAGLFLNIAITLLYTPFLLRKLGQAEYGLYSLVSSVVANLVILDFGFGNAIVKYTAQYRAEGNHEKEKSLHFMFFILYSVIGLIAFVTGLILIRNIKNIFSASLTPEEISTSKTLMLIAVANVSLAFPLGMFGSVIQAYEKFIYLRTMNIMRIFLNPAAVILALLFGYRSAGIILASTVINIAFNAANILYFYNSLHKKISFSKFDFTALKTIAAYSVFILLNIIVERLFWVTDQLILGIFAGTVAVSVYTIGAQFFNCYMQISTSISGIFLPKVVEMDVKFEDERRLSDFFIKVGRLQFMALSFALCWFLLFGREFINFWAGTGYSDAYYVAVIVMTAMIFPLSQNIGISILQAKNKHGFRSVSLFFIAVLNVLLSLALVKPFGVVGCAAATGIAEVLGEIVIMNVYFKRAAMINVFEYWTNVALLAVPIIISLLAGSLINKIVLVPGVTSLLVKTAAYTMLFTAIIWKMGLNEYEKNLALGPLKRMKLSFARE